MELYRPIFQQTEARDLVSLARVSHAFQEEAEDILYLHVDTGHTSDSFISWCLTVVSVPRKALRINTVRLFSNYGHSTTAHFEVDVQKTIAAAFGAMLNLKHLFLFEGGHPHPFRLDFSILKACPFRLLTFCGNAPDSTADDVWQFLAKQDDIQYWFPTKTFLDSISSIPTYILPRLRKVSFINPAQQAIWLSGRPIEVVDFTFFRRTHTQSDCVEGMTSLASFSKTLHTLCYRHGPLYGCSTADMIRSIAQHIPNLRTLLLEPLGVADTIITAERQRSLIEATATFKGLETLILHTRIHMPHRPNGDGSGGLLSEPPDPREHNDIWRERSLNPARCREIAAQFMIACPSLHRLSIPVKSENGSKCSLTYVRSKTGEDIAQFDGFYTMEIPGWRK